MIHHLTHAAAGNGTDSPAGRKASGVHADSRRSHDSSARAGSFDGSQPHATLRQRLSNVFHHHKRSGSSASRDSPRSSATDVHEFHKSTSHESLAADEQPGSASRNAPSAATAASDVPLSPTSNAEAFLAHGNAAAAINSRFDAGDPSVGGIPTGASAGGQLTAPLTVPPPLNLHPTPSASSSTAQPGLSHSRSSPDLHRRSAALGLYATVQPSSPLLPDAAGEAVGITRSSSAGAVDLVSPVPSISHGTAQGGAAAAVHHQAGVPSGQAPSGDASAGGAAGETQPAAAAAADAPPSVSPAAQAWNAVLVRAGFEMLRSPAFEAWLRGLIQKKLDDIKRPPYMHRWLLPEWAELLLYC